MQFALRVEIAYVKVPLADVERVLRADRVIAPVLAAATRQMPHSPWELAFGVRESDPLVLQNFLKRVWAYCFHADVWSYGVLPDHRYTPGELDRAPYLLMRLTYRCEAYGACYPTPYDTSRYCEACGAGLVVRDRLVLPSHRLGWVKNAFAKGSDNEVIIAEDVLQLLGRAGVEDFRLLPIAPAGRPAVRRVPGVWHLQARRDCGPVPSANLVDPGDRCPRYSRDAPHCPGFWLLSPLCLRRDQLQGNLFVTRDHFGQYMGMIRPGPLMVVSQKVRRLLRGAGVMGVTFEPATVLEKPDDGLACGHEFDNLREEAAAMDLVRVPSRPQHPLPRPS